MKYFINNNNNRLRNTTHEAHAPHQPIGASFASFGVQARAIHARTARLEASSSLISTLSSRAIILAEDLMTIGGSS